MFQAVNSQPNQANILEKLSLPEAIHASSLLSTKQVKVFSPLDVPAVVLTGPSCSGKSSIVDALSLSGFSTIEEDMKALNESAKEAGYTNFTLFRNAGLVAGTALGKSVREAYQLVGQDVKYVLDRGLGDAIGMARLINNQFPLDWISPLVISQEQLILHRLELNKAESWGKMLRYERVLWLEGLPFIADNGTRYTNPLIRHLIASNILKAWKDLGYTPLRIPIHPDVEKRAALVKSIAELPKGTSHEEAQALITDFRRREITEIGRLRRKEIAPVHYHSAIS